ncbi:MAG: hypothetical protein AAFY71_16550 [Bacteroidota bacterium]
MKKVILLSMLMGIGFLFAQQSISPKASFHEFDFWLGEWNVYKFDTDTLVGYSRIETIIDSVAILENYRTSKGSYQGKSINKFDPQTGKWDQFWVDNSGLTLKIQGELVDGNMVLGNTGNRITWSPLEGNRVRQKWEAKQADGSWKVVFDGEYRKK